LTLSAGVRATIRHADQQRGIPVGGPAANAAGELAEHTAAVLAAYRELAHETSADPNPLG
jgi:hypothetical protein